MLPFASFARHTALLIIAQIEATADQPHQAKAHPRSDQETHGPAMHVTCFSDHFLVVQIMCYLSM